MDVAACKNTRVVPKVRSAVSGPIGSVLGVLVCGKVLKSGCPQLWRQVELLRAMLSRHNELWI
eukprot:6055563-Amphidinium_carterae.1